MQARTLTLGALVLCLASLGCRQRPLPSVDPVPLDTWRAVLESPGGELPFFLEFSRQHGRLVATLINGTERIPTTDVSLEDGRLTVDFAAFNSRIKASLEDGTLVGSLSVVRAGGARQVMPLRATKGRAARFSMGGEPPEVDVSGRWAAVFRRNDGAEVPSVGEFTQEGSGLRGTFLTPTGDYRYLAGEVAGRRVRLSAFDGYHAFLFVATVDSSDVLKGEFWSGTHRYETWEAVRDEKASLPDADALTFLKPGARELTFAFPDSTGALVTFADPMFTDKVVVVSVSATWCPNGHDEAAFWAPYHRENRSRGFEMVGLMFEHEASFDRAVRQVKAFADRYDIRYPLLVAGVSDKDKAHRSLPMLNHIMAYPTTLFVDRRGVVRRIHTGFTGPGSGDHYRELTRELTDYVEFLLAERPAEVGSRPDREE